MTNHEYIKQLPPEDLAEMIVDTYGNYYTYYGQALYASPSGGKWYDKEDAIEDTVEWLGQKVKDDMKSEIL